MSLPPVPPRPSSATPTPHLTFESPPHFDNPLAAPRPHRVDPSLGANVSSSRFTWPAISTTAQLQLSYNPARRPRHSRRRRAQTGHRGPPPPPRDGSLTVPLPSTAALTAALPTVTAPSHDPQLQLAWARDVLFLINRTPSLSTSPLALAAAPLVLSLASAAVPVPAPAPFAVGRCVPGPHDSTQRVCSVRY
ncbi:hypothetical protein DFH09DRAFT_1488281 [Mycena vulgaris]|nr:hypothetical protein DFH09DRAFT_1488281 [Mycena vulgaris]